MQENLPDHHIILLNKEGIIVSTNIHHDIGVSDLPYKNLSIGSRYIKAWEIYSRSSEDQCRQIIDNVSAALDGGKTTEQEYLLEIDGKLRRFKIFIAPWYDHKTAHAIVIHTEITNINSVQESLEKLYSDLDHKSQALKSSNVELERFAYVASHDLQEPLRMISSFLQLLEMKYKDKLDEQAGKYIFFAKDGAERMKKLIEDLLNYSRVESVKENFQSIATKELMDEMLNLYQIPIKETNTLVEISDLPIITGIKSQIRQLLQNLLGNAIKYRNSRGDQPRIRISAEENASHWIFRIEDNGIGIAPQFLSKVFIMFQRLHTRNEYSGTGIGLAISKKIIEKHNGEIWAESQEGRGSTFFFSISKKITTVKKTNK